MKKIIVEFQSDWVLSHREDECLPVEFLVKAVKQLGGISAESDSLTTASVLFDGDDEQIRNKILDVLKHQYPETDFNQVIEFEISEAKEPSKAQQEQPSETSEPKIPPIDLGGAGASAESTSEPKSALTVDDALQEIDALIGADEFKALCKEFAVVAPEIIKNKCPDVFTYQSYLFSVNDGYGLSTYLEKFSRLISALGIDQASSEEGGLLSAFSAPRSAVYEEVLPAVKESMEPFEDVLRLVRNAKKGSLSVMCIDISEWMNHTESRFFKEFLRVLEGAMDKFIIVFRIPFVEKDVLEVIRYSLYDLVSIRTVTFPPMTKDEIQRYAQDKIARYGFTVEDNAWDYFHRRISEEKSDGKFYGLNTVQKVLRELLYHKYLHNALAGDSGNTVIDKNDSKALIAGSGDDLTGTEMLEKLVGSASIKNQIEEIIAQIELTTKNNSDRPCIHMRFLGNPGTGKTTVARIVGKILKERGVLRVGNFFEYAGRDFCGRYIGETAPKTASICRDAYGSVLFIDEAYSLYRGDDNSRDYGREALDTLIAEMENHRSDLVVIMAGYSDEMEKLMEGNIGLKSRMPYAIEFPNFTSEQLGEIFMSMIGDKFAYDEGIPDLVRRYFNAIPAEVLTSKEFANARFVRNLFERTWAKAAMRCQLAKEKDVTLTCDDFNRAIADKEFAFSEKKKTRLGF